MNSLRLCGIITIFYLCALFEVKASVRHVSSSEGNDDFDGKSSVAPKKTILNAISLADTVLLKSGDVFYEQVVAEGKVISRYGEGPNPTISGLKTLIASGCWRKVEDSIWVIDLSGDYYTGFDTHGASLLNNVGCIYDRDNDVVYGNKVRTYAELRENWDIWQTERFDRNTPSSEFSTLYLYLDDNPNLMNLAFSVGGIGISIANCTLQGVNVIGFGFGISAGKHVEISNCKVDIIGGMTQLGKEWFVNYGNGIEFYVSYDISNSKVHDCYVSRTYDSGITIQAGSENFIPRKIKIYNNLIENCCQAWEDFLMTPNDTVVFHECEFYKNIIINSGTPGFTYKGRTQFCHIFGLNNKGEKGMIIRDNVFAGGNFYHSTSYHGRYYSNVWNNNICYLSAGNFLLCDHEGSIDNLTVVNSKKENKGIVSRYRDLTGDDTRFYVYSENRVKRIANKLKKSFLKKHTY